MPCLKHCEGFVKHVHKNKIILGFNGLTTCFRHKIDGEGCNFKFNNLFLDVWYVPCVIECIYTSFMAIAHHENWLSLEFKFC